MVIQSEASQATHWCTKETCVRQAVLSLGYHPPERWTDLDWAGLEKKSDESSEVKPSQNTTLVQYHQVQVRLTKLQQQRPCPSLPSPEPCFQALAAALCFQLSTCLCCIYFVRQLNMSFIIIWACNIFETKESTLQRWCWRSLKSMVFFPINKDVEQQSIEMDKNLKEAF